MKIYIRFNLLYIVILFIANISCKNSNVKPVFESLNKKWRSTNSTLLSDFDFTTKAPTKKELRKKNINGQLIITLKTSEQIGVYYDMNSDGTIKFLEVYSDPGAKTSGGFGSVIYKNELTNTQLEVKKFLGLNTVWQISVNGNYLELINQNKNLTFIN